MEDQSLPQRCHLNGICLEATEFRDPKHHEPWTSFLDHSPGCGTATLGPSSGTPKVISDEARLSTTDDDSLFFGGYDHILDEHQVSIIPVARNSGAPSLAMSSAHVSPQDGARSLHMPTYPTHGDPNVRFTSALMHAGNHGIPEAHPRRRMEAAEESVAMQSYVNQRRPSLIPYGSPEGSALGSPVVVSPAVASPAGSTKSTSSRKSGSVMSSESASRPQPMLHVPVRSQNQKMVAMLLKHRAVAVDETDSQGRSALHIACQLGDKALVMMLLLYGADPHLCDDQGLSPLYLAVSEGHDMVVELMLRLSASIWLGRRLESTL